MRDRGHRDSRTRRGLAFRPPRPERGRMLPEEKLELETDRAASVAPIRVRVEVLGLNLTTGAALRAQRVERQIKEMGGVAEITGIGPDRSELVAEVEAGQAHDLARHPFIRKIISLN